MRTVQENRKRLLDIAREKIRVKHYSIRTEEAYLHWMRRYVLFHGKQHPARLGAPEIEAPPPVDTHLMASAVSGE